MFFFFSPYFPSASVSQVISRLASLALAAALIISPWSPGNNHFCSAAAAEVVVEAESSQAPLTPSVAAASAAADKVGANDEITNNHVEKKTGDDNGVDGMGFNNCLNLCFTIKQYFAF